MASSRRVREAARRFWLLGYSDEKIIPLLATDFPDEKTPSRSNTILEWRQKDGWKADLEIIEVKAEEKRREMLSEELAAANEKALTYFDRLDTHMNLMLQRVVRTVVEGVQKIVDTQLTAAEIAHLATAGERSIKAQRLIREQSTAHIKTETEYKLNHTLMTDQEVERLADGEPLHAVLSSERINELRVD